MTPEVVGNGQMQPDNAYMQAAPPPLQRMPQQHPPIFSTIMSQLCLLGIALDAAVSTQYYRFAGQLYPHISATPDKATARARQLGR